MALVRLNNLTKPRQIFSDVNNYQKNFLDDKKAVYTDLHLDLRLKEIRDLSENSFFGDIETDNDISAIRNSIKNIFTTKKGQKVYDPEFGASLEQFLFEVVDEFHAKLIGEEILKNIETFEPRIRVLKVQVIPIPDDNEYQIALYYEFLKLKKNELLKLKVLNNGQIIL